MPKKGGLTTAEVADYEGVSIRRVQAKIKQDQNPKRKIKHYPNAKKIRVKQIIYKDEWIIPFVDLAGLKRKKKDNGASNAAD